MLPCKNLLRDRDVATAPAKLQGCNRNSLYRTEPQLAVDTSEDVGQTIQHLIKSVPRRNSLAENVFLQTLLASFVSFLVDPNFEPAIKSTNSLTRPLSLFHAQLLS